MSDKHLGLHHHPHIHDAIERLKELTGEDFHGYRSEIWGVLAQLIRATAAPEQPITAEALAAEGWEHKEAEGFFDVWTTMLKGAFVIYLEVHFARGPYSTGRAVVWLMREGKPVTIGSGVRTMSDLRRLRELLTSAEPGEGEL